MAHEFGDVVIYVKAGVETNALVVQSQQQPDGEHLQVVYLNPDLASSQLGLSQVEKAIVYVFATPLTEGKTYGWKDSDLAADLASMKKDAAITSQQFLDAQKQIEESIAERDAARSDFEVFLTRLVQKLDMGSGTHSLDSILDAALAKSSGDDQNAGDWTQHGDGTDYPDAKPTLTQAQRDALATGNRHIAEAYGIDLTKHSLPEAVTGGTPTPDPTGTSIAVGKTPEPGTYEGISEEDALKQVETPATDNSTQPAETTDNSE